MTGPLEIIRINPLITDKHLKRFEKAVLLLENSFRAILVMGYAYVSTLKKTRVIPSRYIYVTLFKHVKQLATNCMKNSFYIESIEPLVGNNFYD